MSLDTSKWESFRCDPPPGACVYCGSTEPPLTDEHIIPQGLGNRYFVPNASCAVCQRETQAFEEKVLRGMMWPLRAMTGLKGKKRKPPTHLRFDTHTAFLRPLSVNAEVKDIPLLAILPVWMARAGIIEGRLREPNPKMHHFNFIQIVNNKAASRANLRGWRGFDQEVPFRAFAQMLCKIAHVQTVVEFGYRGFEPFLTDIILGKTRDWAHFVGNVPFDNQTFSPNTTHGAITSLNPTDGLIRVYVSLFSFMQKPVYEIVSGRHWSNWRGHVPQGDYS